MTWNRIILVAVLVASAESLYAYKEEVHEAMTGHVYDRLTIDFASRLGIQRQSEASKTLRALMIQAAFDEDHTGWTEQRPLNHFYDPLHEGKALRVPANFCNELGQPADEWALNAAGATGNVWSMHEAKARYESALLGPNPGTRNVFLGDLFTTFGHVAHLIQDMAQPEHTRNDQHLPGSQKLLGNGVEASIYEDWGGQHLADSKISMINFDGYPAVRLPDYASYFHTNHMEGGRPAGKGMADYSSTNFVTQDTNYHDEDPYWHCPGSSPPSKKCDYFSEPKLAESVATLRKDQLYAVYDGVGHIEVLVDEEVYRSFPRDRYLGKLDDDFFHTFRSSIDIETGRYGCKPLYSLGDGSYLNRAALLVPRAVAYSAGIVEHFFRGAIGATWKAVEDVHGVYQLTITNQSAEPIGVDARLSAIFVAPPEYFGRSNSDDTMPIYDEQFISELVPSFAGLPPGQSITLPYVTVPGLAPGDTLGTFERRLVIKGSLGSEAHAVIGFVQPASVFLAKLESSPDLVRMFVLCRSGTYPRDYATLPPQHEIRVEMSGNEHCRVVLQHMQKDQAGAPGVSTTLNLKVFKRGVLVENLNAVIDASDVAVGGCHTVSHSGHCDRWIQRVFGCGTKDGWYSCQKTVEPWDHTGQYATTPSDGEQ